MRSAGVNAEAGTASPVRRARILDASELTLAYGNIVAVRGISFHIDPGEIVALLGSNGAGKSTTLKAISGLVRPVSGAVTFLDARISGRAPEDIVRRGVIQVPEGRQLFERMTIRENLRIGAYLEADARAITSRMDHVLEMFPRIASRLRAQAGTLSGGERQMLAIGRALMANPKLLLLDEPSLGLAPLVIDQVFEAIRKLPREGITVLLVEQNARQALMCADRGYVLEMGRITMEDSAANLLKSDEVVRAYLGDANPSGI